MLITMEKLMWMENYLNEAEALIMEGRVNEGMTLLDHLLFDEPGYGPLHNVLGWANMFYVNDIGKAEMYFRYAIKFAPDFAPPYLHLGNLLNRAGRHSEAIEMFRDGLTKPGAIRIALLEGIALAHEMQGEYRRAMLMYKEAAAASIVDMEVERMLKNAKRCRRKRMASFLFF